MKNNLQELRWEKNWSRKQLHIYSGVSASAITHIENDKDYDPSVSIALKLAKAFHVKVEDIFQL